MDKRQQLNLRVWLKKEMGMPMVANLNKITKKNIKSATETGKEARFEGREQKLIYDSVDFKQADF